MLSQSGVLTHLYCGFGAQLTSEGPSFIASNPSEARSGLNLIVFSDRPWLWIYLVREVGANDEK